MMEQPSLPTPDLRTLLAKLEIKRVAIIDDAVKPPSRVDTEIHDALDSLLGADGGKHRSIIGHVCGTSREIRTAAEVVELDGIIRLWQFALSPDLLLDIQGEFAFALRTLVFQDKYDEIAPLLTLQNWLASLGQDVEMLSPEDHEQLQGADLWFFDLIWRDRDIDNGFDELLQRASGVAKRCYHDRVRSEAPPIFVLMSSDEKKLGENQELFRVASGVPAGYFLALDKKILREEEDSEFRGWLAKHLEYQKAYFRRNVYGLVRAVTEAAATALEQYKGALHDITPEDYAHIYRYSLKDEGAPLGSYMLWLIEPLFEHYLKEDADVHRYRQRLDALGHEDVPKYELATHEPSSTLSEIHSARMWEQVDSSLEKRLHQGDLLSPLDDDHRVYLVLNADCDLAYSTAPGSARKQKDISIILLPGDVAKFGIDGDCTEFYEAGDVDGNKVLRLRRIKWLLTKIETVEYSKVSSCYRKRGWRLRRPFLSAVVQKWSHQVTRFGTPVSPAVIDVARCRQLVCRASAEDEWKAYDIAVEQPVFIFREKNNKATLVLRSVDELAGAIVQKQELVGLSAYVKALTKKDLNMTGPHCKVTANFWITLDHAQIESPKVTVALVLEIV